MTIYIVTDLGYGDSGKGTTVDYLAREGKSLVVRHNGGANAGHNVVLEDGTHHEFRQFGSGTLAGADTFLSRYALVDPEFMLIEGDLLDTTMQYQDSVWWRMYVDINAKIVTPYHKAYTRLLERARGDDRHGSTGMGIGAVMQQHIERPDLTLTVRDLLFVNEAFVTLESKLAALQRYLNIQNPGAGQPGCAWSKDSQLLKSSDSVPAIAKMFHDWRTKVTVHVNGTAWLTKSFGVYDNVIFEGAQGVLLDEWRGFHPYTTWSTTTSANAETLIEEALPDDRKYYGPKPYTRLGVTRAYMTRHGAGPFVTEDESLHYTEPHNTTGKWQGHFRQGHLDRMMLEYAVEVTGGIDGLVVTHLDRSDIWKYSDSYNLDYFHAYDIIPNPEKHNLNKQGELAYQVMHAKPCYLKPMTTSQLLATLENIAPIHITSHGPTAADKVRVKEEVNA